MSHDMSNPSSTTNPTSTNAATFTQVTSVRKASWPLDEGYQPDRKKPGVEDEDLGTDAKSEEDKEDDGSILLPDGEPDAEEATLVPDTKLVAEVAKLEPEAKSEVESERGAPVRRRSSTRKADAELSNAILQLGINLYRAVRSVCKVGDERKGNVLLSPYQIASALQLLYTGAQGDTAAQIGLALGWPPKLSSKTEKRVSSYFAHRDHHVMQGDAKGAFKAYYDLCLHRDRRVVLKTEFEARLGPGQASPPRQQSDGSIRECAAPRRRRMCCRTHDFVNDSVHQRWKMESQMTEAVPLLKSCGSYECVPSGSVGEDTSLVLLCAMGVKGRWRRRFDPAQVREGVFYEPADGELGCTDDQFCPRPVVMMHHTGCFRMADCGDLEATALELPYKHARRTLIILLPQRRDGLETLEARMTAATLAECIRNLKRRPDVDVSLPKFHVHSVADLAAALSSMGVDALFQEGVADLSGMCSNEGVAVSSARHVAAFRASWKGRISRKKPPPQPSTEHEKFTVDRPFLFLVRCKRPNAVILLGSVRKVRPHFQPHLLPKSSRPPRLHHFLS